MMCWAFAKLAYMPAAALVRASLPHITAWRAPIAQVRRGAGMACLGSCRMVVQGVVQRGACLGRRGTHFAASRADCGMSSCPSACTGLRQHAVGVCGIGHPDPRRHAGKLSSFVFLMGVDAARRPCFRRPGHAVQGRSALLHQGGHLFMPLTHFATGSYAVCSCWRGSCWSCRARHSRRRRTSSCIKPR